MTDQEATQAVEIAACPDHRREYRECASGCGAQLDPDMGPYCPECQARGLDPEVR